MIKRARILIKSIFIFAALEGAAFPAGGGGILAFGDIRDHLEPCGCDPRTDVGGLRRLDSAARRYQNVFPNLTIVNLGNVTDSDKGSPSSQAILKVLEELRPAVSLINSYEWRRIDRKLPLANIPWVLSNALVAKAKRSWSDKIVVNSYEFFGYLGKTDKLLETAGPELYKKWKSLSSVTSSSQRVLLFSGTDKEVASIIESKIFGVIIRSSTVPLGTEVGDLEQKNEGRLGKSFKGQIIWSVPFGGAGFLRLAGLETARPPEPLTTLLQKSSATANGQAASSPAKDPLEKLIMTTPIHWLRQDEEAGLSPAVSRIFDDLRHADKDRFRALIAARQADLKNTDFVGSEACAGCHQSAYEVWKKSKHAKAIVSLLSRSRHEDAGCVECHVLGFNAKGGYVSEEHTPQFSNVHCENCHGPRRQHLKNPMDKPSGSSTALARAACVECHTPPHSPGYQAHPYWKAIEHK